jgi:hypothetical protein
MTKWATVDRELLQKRRDEQAAELRAIANKIVRTDSVEAFKHAVQVAELSGCVLALDAVLEATKPRSEG